MNHHSFFEINKSASQELRQLLNHNIIGTPGQSMLYQHLGVHNKIDKIDHPYYVTLARNNKITGTCCFCKRITLNNERELTSFYIRYFTFRDKFRSKQGKEKSVQRKSVLREEIKALLSGERFDIRPNEKCYHYAYVDPRNSRSMLLCKEFGFEPVRQFTTIIFNRILPKENKEVKTHKITPDEEPEVKQLLADFNKNHNMFSWENLFRTRAYYTIKDQQGQIVAGAQVNPDLWKIISLPGITGKIILNTFTHLPYLNRLFNKKYQFITIEGIYYKPGSEQYLGILFESLLSIYKVNSAIIPVDADSTLYKTLKSIKLGWVDKLNKEVRGNIICKFIGFTEQEKKQFKENPAYISGIDVT